MIKLRLQRVRFVSLFSVLILSFTSCTRSPKGDNAVVARVGKEKITVGEFRQAMERRGGRISNAYADPANKEALLEEIIRLEVLAAKAGEKGYFEDPAISLAIKRLVVQKLQEKTVGISVEDVKVTDAEVAAFYRDNAARYVIPARIQAAVVFVAVSAKASDEKRSERAALAAQILEEARHLDPSVKDFGYVAAQHSDDQVTRYRGGDTGWLAMGGRAYRWPNELLEPVFALGQPGDMTNVLPGPGGYYVFKLVEREPASAIPLEKVSANIRLEVAQQKLQKRMDDLYAESRTGMKITIDRDLLNSIQPPAPTQAEHPDKVPPPMPQGS